MPSTPPAQLVVGAGQLHRLPQPRLRGHHPSGLDIDPGQLAERRDGDWHVLHSPGLPSRLVEMDRTLLVPPTEPVHQRGTEPEQRRRPLAALAHADRSPQRLDARVERSGIDGRLPRFDEHADRGSGGGGRSPAGMRNIVDRGTKGR
jgi:hypothetical protein